MSSGPISAAETALGDTSTASHLALRRRLRVDQQAAVEAAVRHLKSPRTRGHIVSACGTGKTLIALRTAEQLGVRHLLIAVPSLDLIGQWAAAVRLDGRRESLMTVSSLDAGKHPLLAAAGAVSTNSGEYLAYWLAQRSKRREGAIVFVTLDSLPRIEEAQHPVFAAPVFDLMIVDEVHRTAGSWDKEWTMIHDHTRIPADRRLYLTATPYEWEAPRLTEAPDTRPQPKRTAATAPEWQAPSRVASMDDPRVFGPRLHTYSHADAIDDGVLADYQLLVPTITDTDLRTHLTDTNAHVGFALTARRTTALHLAVLKAMREHDLHHVIVYFQQIADAADFARQFPHTLCTLPEPQRPAWTDELSVQSINGSHTPDQRHQILTRFAAAGRAVLTNAQVLGEGVDLPAVDAIVFADRTASVRRIVQALGRALRKPPTWVRRRPDRLLRRVRVGRHRRPQPQHHRRSPHPDRTPNPRRRPHDRHRPPAVLRPHLAALPAAGRVRVRRPHRRTGKAGLVTPPVIPPVAIGRRVPWHTAAALLVAVCAAGLAAHHWPVLEAGADRLAVADRGWLLTAGVLATLTWASSAIAQQGAVREALPTGRLVTAQFAASAANHLLPAGLAPGRSICGS